MPKILVIEDSKLSRMRIMNTLNRGGYKNIVGVESYKSIERNLDEHLKDVDLIITDIGLPDVNGIDLIGMLKKDSKYFHIPVVFISAYGDKNTITKALKVGATDYIVKPFDNEVLLERINKIILKPLYFNQDRVRDIEKIKMTAALEYERAMRSGQPFSIIHVCVDSENAHEIFVQIRNILRKIDSVYLVGNCLIVMLPLTGRTGTDVVFRKMKAITGVTNEKLSDVSIQTYNNGIETNIDDFFDLLDSNMDELNAKNYLQN